MSDKSADTVFGNWFKDQGDPARNPVKLAQSAMRPPLPARFYTLADIVEDGGLFHLRLDGKRAFTPAKNALAVTTGAAGAQLAAEWNAQIKVIDPAGMHATRIVNAAIDHVVIRSDEVRAEIVRYAGSDLLCYRAGEPDRLVALQQEHWDPLIDWAHVALGVKLRLAQGVMFQPQTEESLRQIAATLDTIRDPVALSALHVLTSLGGSVVLALAVARRRLTPANAYDASELDADFTSELWGIDEDAAYRRRRRLAEFVAAGELLLAVT